MVPLARPLWRAKTLLALKQYMDRYIITYFWSG